MRPQQARLSTFLAGATFAVGVILTLSAQTRRTATRIALPTAEQLEILGHMRIVYRDDGSGILAKTIRIDGVNLQLVSGLGATNGYPADPSSVNPLLTETNSLGNLIIGYEDVALRVRTGSHNLVVGERHSYTSFGGLLAGYSNTTAGAYASTSGGNSNTASGPYSAVSGGAANEASGAFAAVTGGGNNTASASQSSVTGGFENTASASASTVTGGVRNRAAGAWSMVAAGRNNRAVGLFSSVLGGGAPGPFTLLNPYANEARGDYSVVCGGNERTVTGTYNWRAGSLFEND
jgi:hypothetical protein